jgi:D-glycero-D-manno-heptose 1,7-bisphosphate phosphatase
VNGVEAILLDRDSVINQPVLDPRTGTYESPLSASDVRLVPGAATALVALREAGVRLIVASNQPAAAKGTVPLHVLEAVHARTVELLARDGVTLDRWEYCYHHPAGVLPELTGSCDCRKPRPGLLLRALRAADIAPERAWMVGDAFTDVAAGRAAGTRTALIEHPLTAHRRRSDSGAVLEPDVSIPDLLEFVQTVLQSAGFA